MRGFSLLEGLIVLGIIIALSMAIIPFVLSGGDSSGGS